MERKRMIAVGAAAGFAAGLTGGLIYRYRTVDKGKKPLPITAQRQPGTDTSALEVDKATNIITVRTASAQKLFELLKGYALEPLGDSGQGEQARFSLVKKDPKTTDSASAASWLITAANAGFDVLIDERVTAILAGGTSPDPGGIWLSSVVITRPADTVKFATYPAMKYAVLFNGDPKGSGAFPAPPAYATLPPATTPATPSTPAQDIAKSVTSGAESGKDTLAGPLITGGGLLAIGALAVRQYKRDGAKLGWDRLDATTDKALLAAGVAGGGAFLYGLTRAVTISPAAVPASPGLTLTTTKGAVRDRVDATAGISRETGLSIGAVAGTVLGGTMGYLLSNRFDAPPNTVIGGVVGGITGFVAVLVSR